MMHKVIRDVKTFFEARVTNEYAILKEGSVVLLLNQKEFNAYGEQIYRYRFLEGNCIHIVTCRLDAANDHIIVEDAWQEKFHIKDFSNEEKFYWKNTFQKIESEHKDVGH